MVAARTETMPEGTSFRPEEGAVLRDKHDKRGKAQVAPLNRRGAGVAAKTHKGVEHDAGDEEAHASSKERWQFLDGNADGKKRYAQRK